MARFVVDEFVIELNLQDKITKGLAKAEAKAKEVSERIERNLNGIGKNLTLSKDFQKQLNSMVSNTDKASRKMKKSISSAFDVKSMTKPGLKDFEKSANAIAGRVRKQFNFRHGGGVGGSAGGANIPRRPRQQPAPEEFINRLRNTPAFQSLRAMGGNASIRAMELESRAIHSVVRNADQASQALHTFNQSLRRSTATTQEERRAERATARARLRDDLRARGVTGRTNRLAMGVAKGEILADVIGGGVTMIAGAAAEFMRGSYEAGKERAQSETMVRTAVNDPKQLEAVRKQLDTYGNNYGIDQTEVNREYATMRNAFSKEKISNPELIKMMENESVFGHTAGVNNEQISRANAQISQIAGGSKISKADLNALQNNIPEWARVIGTGLNKSSDWVKQNYKDISPDKFLKAWQAGLQKLNDQSGATLAAQQSIQAQEGRLRRAWANDEVAFFQGSGKSYSEWMGSFTNTLNGMQPVFKAAGEGVAHLSDRFGDIGNALERDGKAWSEFWKSLTPEQQGRLEVIGKFFEDVGDSLVNAPFDNAVKFLDNLTTFAKLLTGNLSDKDAKKMIQQQSGQYEGSNLEAGVNWVKGLLGFGDNSAPTTAASTTAPKPQSKSGWQSMLDLATSLTPNLAPAPSALPKAPQKIQVETTNKLDIPDRPLIIQGTIDGAGNFVSHSSLKEILGNHTEAQNYATNYLDIDYNEPYQFQGNFR
ncbi:tape measure protein [Pseudocitrobacter faecalis]|uniref:tape measure protein n=1 Tax=Pseudocitrobacter faecalis TaxID=1398493 RepID=UPI003899E507